MNEKLKSFFSPPEEEKVQVQELPEELPEPDLFDIIKDISENQGQETRKYLKEHDRLPRNYSPYMVAKAFGNFYDTVLWANEVNRYYSIPEPSQFYILAGTIKPKRRFAKWYKPYKEEVTKFLADLFGYSEREMRLNMANVPDELIREAEKQMEQIAKNGKESKKK